MSFFVKGSIWCSLFLRLKRKFKTIRIINDTMLLQLRSSQTAIYEEKNIYSEEKQFEKGAHN